MAKEFFLTYSIQFPNKQVRAIAIETLERNAFFSHPENILMAMLADSNQSVRQRAIVKWKMHGFQLIKMRQKPRPVKFIGYWILDIR